MPRQMWFGRWRDSLWLVAGAAFVASCSVDDPLNPQPEPPGDNTGNPKASGGAGAYNAHGTGGNIVASMGGMNSTSGAGDTSIAKGSGGMAAAGTTSVAPNTTGGSGYSTGGAAATGGKASAGGAGMGGSKSTGGATTAGGRSALGGGTASAAETGGRSWDNDAGTSTGGTSTTCSDDAGVPADSGCP